MNFYIVNIQELHNALFERGWIWTNTYRAGDQNWSHPTQPKSSFTLEQAIRLEGLKAELRPCSK